MGEHSLECSTEADVLEQDSTSAANPPERNQDLSDAEVPSHASALEGQEDLRTDVHVDKSVGGVDTPEARALCTGSVQPPLEQLECASSLDVNCRRSKSCILGGHGNNENLEILDLETHQLVSKI